MGLPILDYANPVFNFDTTGNLSYTVPNDGNTYWLVGNVVNASISINGTKVVQGTSAGTTGVASGYCNFKLDTGDIVTANAVISSAYNTIHIFKEK